jgi:hypothetical protein
MTVHQQAYSERVKRLYPLRATYNELTVIGYERQPKGYWHVICRCSCGTVKSIKHPRMMRAHKIKSCGCLNRKMASARRLGKPPTHALPTGLAANRLKWRSYKLNAARASHVFGLSFEQFHTLTVQPCCYCGAPPTMCWQAGRYNGACASHGLDRTDNSKGYTLDNVVPCCKICNRAKSNLTVDEFAAWLERVYKHLKIYVSR